jgi:hypothetical protein
VVLLFALTGCATAANYETILNSWVGVHVDNLGGRPLTLTSDVDPEEERYGCKSSVQENDVN